MAIRTGRYGQVLLDPAPPTPPTTANPVEIVSLNAWKLSEKTDKEDVTCFGDENKVYVPGMKDISGTLGGFWNSVAGGAGVLFDAADSDVPGFLKLVPNNSPSEMGWFWSGLAYLDAEIDCTVNGAPKVTGEFMAAAKWSRAVGTP
jgi:hypothetical protein